MTLTDLQQQFSSVDWPEFLALTAADNVITLRIRVSPEVRWLTGHFPEQPVLAGVVQTHWAAELGQHLFGLQGAFQRIDNLKFQTVVLPEQVMDLRLEYDSTARSIRFSYRAPAGNESPDTASAALMYSEGKLVFQAPVDLTP